jgi:hypothetical protein
MGCTPSAGIAKMRDNSKSKSNKYKMGKFRGIYFGFSGRDT